MSAVSKEERECAVRAWSALVGSLEHLENNSPPSPQLITLLAIFGLAIWLVPIHLNFAIFGKAAIFLALVYFAHRLVKTRVKRLREVEEARRASTDSGVEAFIRFSDGNVSSINGLRLRKGHIWGYDIVTPNRHWDFEFLGASYENKVLAGSVVEDWGGNVRVLGLPELIVRPGLHYRENPTLEERIVYNTTSKRLPNLVTLAIEQVDKNNLDWEIDGTLVLEMRLKPIMDRLLEGTPLEACPRVECKK